MTAIEAAREYLEGRITVSEAYAYYRERSQCDCDRSPTTRSLELSGWCLLVTIMGVDLDTHDGPAALDPEHIRAAIIKARLENKL